jgi:DNA mismatch endonuclease (patch repair protein)
MADTVSRTSRSENMRRIRSAGMKPEMIVRSLVHRLGYRFRLHARELAGKPDIVRRPQKQAIFVHGCFWHQHPKQKCLDGRLPKSNTTYWHPKLSTNVDRDKAAVSALKKAGWRVMIVWECETKNTEALERRLRKFLEA